MAFAVGALGQEEGWGGEEVGDGDEEMGWGGGWR